jgi:hypothetical protein
MDPRSMEWSSTLETGVPFAVNHPSICEGEGHGHPRGLRVDEVG